MKKRYLLLIILLLVIGIVKVDAKTYTSYVKGDKITVNVNDTTKLDFYVIEDSSDGTVTAIYEDVLGEEFEFELTTDTFEGSDLETELNELTSSWDNPDDIRLIEADEIIPGIEVSDLLNINDTDEFDDSVYHIQKAYFTQTIFLDGELRHIVEVWNWNVFSTLWTDREGSSYAGYIRPVITIDKDYVEGGVIEEGVETPTDFSHINFLDIDVYAQTGTAGASLIMTLKGNLNSNYNYYVKFVNKGDAKPNDYNDMKYVEGDLITEWQWVNYNKEDKNYYVSVGGDWYMLNGYDYAYFVACYENTCAISDNPVKVNRPKLPELGQRYHIFAFGDEYNTLDVFPYFPYIGGDNGSHTINVKIGLINDEKLIYSVLNKEKGALENLMEYAKKNEGKIFTINDLTNEMALDLKVQNGSYYFIYTTYENSDGMYRDLSDITIAIGENDMIVNDIEWNPSTGDISLVAIIGGTLLLAGVAVFAYRRIRLN